ncbi:hypothetical protein HS7_19050 [Sulfolobales archaeon HS-7]|nr:hypothetical protein HS7_19050 [Sulfolobales archaeon HS-7]
MSPNDKREEFTEELKRGGPRSRLMEAVLLLLQGRPMKTSEISRNLGYETKYISSYLSYWKRKGLVYLEGGRWHLSPLGEDLAKDIADAMTNSRADKYIAMAKQIVEEHVKESINNKVNIKKNNRKQESLSFIDSLTSKEDKERQKQNCMDEILDKLNEEEKSVVEYLLSKYIEWGSAYVYSDQIQEEMGADHVWLFKVLRMLQSKRLIYLYHDPKLGLRVGFSTSIKRLLESC